MTLHETLQLAKDFQDIAHRYDEYGRALNEAFSALVLNPQLTEDERDYNGGFICRTLGSDLTRRVVGPKVALPFSWFRG